MTALEAFKSALERVSIEQINHPFLGVQERVLCYELYHQFRLLEENESMEDFRPARLQAELDKDAQHIFKNHFGESEPVPDFLLHKPGYDSHNLAVVEVKRAEAENNLILHDLKKLFFFSQRPLSYRERILIVAGNRNKLNRSHHLINSINSGRLEECVAVQVLFYDHDRRSLEHQQIMYNPEAINV